MFGYHRQNVDYRQTDKYLGPKMMVHTDIRHKMYYLPS